MKMRLWSKDGWSGNPLAKDEFAFTFPSGAADRDNIVFHCQGNWPRPRLCLIPIVRGPRTENKWGWDGNMEEPTITPSIGCDARCGWHGHITKGDWHQ